MTIRKKFLGATSAILTLAFAGEAISASYSNFVVTGNGRIEDSVILGVAGLVSGNNYQDAEVNAALQRLYASGLFSNVEIVPQGNTLVINVTENATVGRVFFEGNENIKDEALAEFVTIKPRDGLDKTVVEENAQSIRRAYAARSRLDAKVTPVVIPVREGVFNVVFEIDEGVVADVERVTFTGNEQVPDRALRDVIISGEHGILGGIFSGDDYAQEKLLGDQEKIENYYHENGYYGVEIRSVNANYDALGNYYLTYTIDEGQRYNFGKISYSSEVPGVAPHQYERLSKVHKGQVFKASDVRDTIEAIEHQASIDGFPFLRVEPVVNANEANGTLDVNFRFYQGAKVYADRIDIHGNDSTIDRVIRRQFEIVEGDPINHRKISEAKENIEGTGFFSRVEVNTRESSTIGKQIIDVEVEETTTGTLNFGLGYNDTDGTSLFAQLTERNFLGRGQRVSTKIDWSESAQSFNFDFTEPGLFERDVAGGFGIYYGNRDRESARFQTTDMGFEPRLSFPVSENSRFAMGYFLRSNEIREVSEFASPLIAKEEGTAITSGISASWIIDRSTSLNDVTRGFIARLGGEFAGLGGDAQWYRLNGRAKVFYPFWNDRMTFTATLDGGLIESLNDDPVRVTERSYRGGDSFYGFRAGGLGPRDFTDEINSSLGGKYYSTLLTEVQFPLGLPEELGVTGAAFYQAGSVWGLDETKGAAMGEVDDDFHLRQSAGASIIWNLGQQKLRFTWSDVIESQSYDQLDNFQISIQTKF